MKARPILSFVIVILGICLIGTVYLFMDFVQGIRVYEDDGMEVDVIVALAGGMGRLEEGMKLLASGRARYLILAGLDRDANLDAIFFRQDIKAMVDPSRIILEKGSESTYENALRVKGIVEDKGFKSITLITSTYHIKRAYYTFIHILPKGVHISPHPVSTPNFIEMSWWRDGRSIGILVLEFLKFYWYRVWI
ncbi:MAG: YdcF family protein [Deltaproteobacteria bacterium]|nr:YdcF family protein [Deltaproteobacteria bacterium]